MDKLLGLKEIGEWVLFYFTLFKVFSIYIFLFLFNFTSNSMLHLLNFPYHSQQCLLSCPSYEFLFVR